MCITNPTQHALRGHKRRPQRWCLARRQHLARSIVLLFSEHILCPNLPPKSALFTMCHCVSQPCFWPRLFLLFNRNRVTKSYSLGHVMFQHCIALTHQNACDIPAVQRPKKISANSPEILLWVSYLFIAQTCMRCPCLLRFLESEDARPNISTSREHQREPGENIFKW